MKFYNPFKPHIVERDGIYAIRRWDFDAFGYTFLDLHNDYWWHMEKCVLKYAKSNDLAATSKRLEELTKKCNKLKPETKWKAL